MFFYKALLKMILFSPGGICWFPGGYYHVITVDASEISAVAPVEAGNRMLF